MFDMFDTVDVALMLAGVIVIVVGFAVLALLLRRHEDRRWEDLAVWAHDNRLKFNSKEDRSINYRFPFFNLPKGDGDHYAFNIMEGVFAGRQIWAFDYFWLKDNGVQDSVPRYEHYWRSFVAVEVGVLLEALSTDPIRFVGKSLPLSEREKAARIRRVRQKLLPAMSQRYPLGL